MSYFLSAAARLELKDYAARSKSAIRERAGRAARLASAHPVKTAAAVVSVALVGALVVSAASAETPDPRAGLALTRARKKRAAVDGPSRDDKMDTAPNTVRVFVHLTASRDISRAVLTGMKNAMPIAKDVAELTYNAHSFAERPMVNVESGTAVVLARGACALSGLISDAGARASRVVVLHIGESGEKGANVALADGWRKYETKVNGNEQLTAYVFSGGPCTVLVDADDTFFACTLIRDESLVYHTPDIAAKHYFAAGGGGRLRAESMFVCHQKVRALPIVDDVAAFDRVFVVSPRGSWLTLAECLETHGLVTIGIGGLVTWSAKSTMLVVVSPASLLVHHDDVFVVHCMLHTLRNQARASSSSSDVRFTIGADDARLLADETLSSRGPRWTRTCDMFAPFYARSAHVVLAVGPVAIYSSLDRALAPVQKMLDDERSELGLIRAMSHKSHKSHKESREGAPKEDLAGLDPEPALAVFRATGDAIPPLGVPLSIAALGSDATSKGGDVVLIAKAVSVNIRAGSEWRRVWGDRWEIAHTSGDYHVYLMHTGSSFGFGRRFCLYTP